MFRALERADESAPASAPFTHYINNDLKIRRCHVSELPRKAPGVKGHEMLREDMHSPSYEAAAQRSHNTYRRHQGAVYHHSRPLSAAPEYWDGGKIVDRGRGRGEANRHGQAGGPIATAWTERARESPGLAGGSSKARGTAGSGFLDGDSGYIRQKGGAGAAAMGSYDPITHSVLRPPSPDVARGREMEAAQSWRTVGVAHQVAPQGRYDPIRHEWVVPPRAGTRAAAEEAQPPRTSKRSIANGPSWGQHDPIRGEWTLRPATTSFKDASDARGCSGGGRARVERPASTGVYDPIRNTWVEPPQNRRNIEGLSFHPRGLFSTYGRTR